MSNGSGWLSFIWSLVGCRSLMFLTYRNASYGYERWRPRCSIPWRWWDTKGLSGGVVKTVISHVFVCREPYLQNLFSYHTFFCNGSMNIMWYYIILKTSSMPARVYKVEIESFLCDLSCIGFFSFWILVNTMKSRAHSFASAISSLSSSCLFLLEFCCCVYFFSSFIWYLILDDISVIGFAQMKLGIWPCIYEVTIQMLE